MFSQDDGRLFLCLGIMLSTHVTKTIKSRTKANNANEVINGQHEQVLRIKDFQLDFYIIRGHSPL